MKKFKVKKIKPKDDDRVLDFTGSTTLVEKHQDDSDLQPEATFTPSQKKALSVLNGKRNVFVTGAAGSGKSYLINHFRRQSNYPVLASTGAAAILVKGCTFHSFFGLGVMKGGAEETYQQIKEKNDYFLASRLKRADGIIIDEISMIPGEALNVAERVARFVKKSHEPWGGLKVVTVGDFAQLPPVTPASSQRDWCFKSEAWSKSKFIPIVLKELMRTSDANLLKVLNKVREGMVDEKVEDFLDGRRLEVANDFQGTRLFPHRHTVDSFNFQKVKALPGDLLTFKTEYEGLSFAIEILKKQAPVPEELFLKIGALVMVKINDREKRFANGSLGHVVKVDEDVIQVNLLSGATVEFEKHDFKFYDASEKEIAKAVNFPFTLAYATTIHKSQGATIDRVAMDISGLWEPGQAYVALSRAKTAEGIFIEDWDESSIIADPEVIEFHESLLNQNYTTENRRQ